jgi:hypothetical protein
VFEYKLDLASLREQEEESDEVEKFKVATEKEFVEGGRGLCVWASLFCVSKCVD